MSGFEISSIIVTACRTHSVQPCSTVTIARYFALLLCSANQAYTACYLEVTAVKQLSNVSWAAWASSCPQSCGDTIPYHG